MHCRRRELEELVELKGLDDEELRFLPFYISRASALTLRSSLAGVRRLSGYVSQRASALAAVVVWRAHECVCRN